MTSTSLEQIEMRKLEKKTYVSNVGVKTLVFVFF